MITAHIYFLQKTHFGKSVKFYRWASVKYDYYICSADAQFEAIYSESLRIATVECLLLHAYKHAYKIEASVIFIDLTKVLITQIYNWKIFKSSF